MPELAFFAKFFISRGQSPCCAVDQPRSASLYALAVARVGLVVVILMLHWLPAGSYVCEFVANQKPAPTVIAGGVVPVESGT